MCHLDQKSLIDVAQYGLLKFCGNLNPKSSAMPIAISVYPEKSQYICAAYAYIPEIFGRDGT